MGIALSQNTKAEMDDDTALLDPKPPIKQQHRVQQLSQLSYRNKCTIREAGKLAISTASAAKRLSIHLTAPEQQFYGRSATKLVLVDIYAETSEDKIQQISQGTSCQAQSN